MKREFPVLFAKASTVVATPILVLTTISYVQRAISQPASEIYSMALTAFGVTIGLSGICFTAAPTGNDTPMRYSGEKFLHSALLLIQSLIFIYAQDAILSTAWARECDVVRRTTSWFLGSIVLFVSTASAWCWWWGFEALNNELWQNWNRRIDILTGTDKSSKDDTQKPQ